MQFLYSALSSYGLKALYTLLPPAHLYAPTPSQLLNGAYSPTDGPNNFTMFGPSVYSPDTRCKAQRVINVQ